MPGGYQQFDYARSFWAEMGKINLWQPYETFCDSFVDYLNRDLNSGDVWVRPNVARLAR
jgi:hypothetical protein